MLKIAITGANGLVGSRIVELLKNDFEFIPLNRSNGFDITNLSHLTSEIYNLDFDFLLHLAAYTKVDEAETHKEEARKINVEGTKNVFEYVRQKNKKMIYISTGFVFDGTRPPYDENSPPHPLSVYGQTKYEGEKIVGSQGMIVRIEYPYRKEFTPKKDFVRTIKSLLANGQTVKAVNDILITPTFIDDIANGLKYLINNYSPEIFHLVGGSSMSPYEAAKMIAGHFGYDQNLIQSIPAREYFYGKAPRPQYATIMSIKNNFYKMKSFNEGLKYL